MVQPFKILVEKRLRGNAFLRFLNVNADRLGGAGLARSTSRRKKKQHYFRT